MLQPRLVVSYQQSDQRRALAFGQNVSLITVCAVVNAVPRGKNTCISFRWRLATTFITILATVMLFSRVIGVLPNTRHRSQISQLISQLAKGLGVLKHGPSRNRYAIYLIRQQAVVKRAIAHRHPTRPEKEKHLEHCTEESVSFCHKWRQNTTKGLKGVEAPLKLHSKKTVHGRIPKDFAKPSLVSRIYPSSRTIHSTAMENTLTFTRN